MSESRPRVLVTRRIFEPDLERLARAVTLAANQEDESLSAEALAARAAACAGLLVTGGDRIDAALLAAADSLRVVSTISVGYNHIDVAACTARGVLVTNTPDVLTETTADLGFALMLATARRMSEAERWLRAGHWQRWALEQMLGMDVHQRVLGILGMGRIGQAIARRARGFSMRILYHNRRRLDEALEAELGATLVERDELLGRADHIVLVLPYSAENHHLIGARELALMQPGATLTNIARGGLIDEAALVEALRAGRLGGAGLDVFENEPAINPDLLTLERVVLTPHIGSASRATRSAMARLAIDNLLEGLAGRRPPCLVNPEAWRGG